MPIARKIEITIRINAPRCPCGQELDAENIVSASVNYTTGKTRASFRCPTCETQVSVGDDDEEYVGPSPAPSPIPCSAPGVVMVLGKIM